MKVLLKYMIVLSMVMPIYAYSATDETEVVQQGEEQALTDEEIIIKFT